MINYANRGASEYAPENTKSAFYLALVQGASGIHTNLRRTKDGEIVLFHDETLERVAGVTGSVADYTLAELKEFHVVGNSVSKFFDLIMSLKEFLTVFGDYNMKLSFELMEDGLVSDAVSILRDFGVLERSAFASSNLDYLKAAKEIVPEVKCAFILPILEEGEVLDQQPILDAGIEEVCPNAKLLTDEDFASFKENGFSVRPWGVPRVRTMKRLVTMGVDGMEVAFPDRLTQYLGSCANVL